MSIYDEIQAQARVSDTWEKWKDYRNEVTELLLQECADARKIVIVGAGSCDDIDLTKLGSRGKEIVLLDNDEQALRKAQERLRKQKNENVLITGQVMGIDGVEAYMYREFCERLAGYIRSGAGIYLSELDEFAYSLLEEYDASAKKNKEADKGKWQEADVYICMGVCSQLQTMFAYVYHALRGYVMQMAGVEMGEADTSGVEKFEAFLKKRNEQTIGSFHDRMLGHTKYKLIVGNEYQRSLKHDTLKERMYESVLKSGQPIEGAYQAIMDIRGRNLSCKEYTAYWPFDLSCEIGYEMVIQVVTK